MRLLVQHRSHYAFERPAALGPHKVRLRPANHTRARVETYSLRVRQPCDLRWQQDPFGNHVAEVSFLHQARVEALDIEVELAIDIRPVNPFDFFLDPRVLKAPFEYPVQLRQDLLPFVARADPSLFEGERVRAFLDDLPREGDTVGLVVELNRRVAAAVRYVIREEAGIWTPEETLANGRGSCRDSAVLLVAAMRSRGLAARFVSGYLVQLTDEGMIPDEPRGVGRDVVDLHAWAEVYLPGAGWLGLDATSGLFCGEGHIPLACTASPALAAPVEGTTDTAALEVTFEMKVGRLGHEPRPTRPYTDEVWEALLWGAAAADEALEEAGVPLTSGGEPTFNSREHPSAPEWNAEAMGPTKDAQGLRLVEELRRRICPGAAVLRRAGKLYPGESLPRWALELVGRRDGQHVWTGTVGGGAGAPSIHDARELALALCDALGVPCGNLLDAYEDPWRFLQDEAQLPLDVDPLKADVRDPEERRRLARVLDRGLASEVGFALPLARLGGAWQSDAWSFRRGRLYLVPGDGPMGLRLPLGSLGPGWVPAPVEPAVEPPDPRGETEEGREGGQDKVDVRRGAPAPAPAVMGTSPLGLRTALCVEVREGALRVFLPPVAGAGDFFDLVRAVDEVRAARGAQVQLEGYPPPSDPSVFRFSVTPDPGVLEVNVPPSSSSREHARILEAVFDAALHAGLQSEKYLLDGRVAGSGGGHHLTLGGPAPLQSPFVSRPDVLASLITFVQHHPSLSYLFTGLFVGPTSQAPRADEARHDALYELEIALARAFERGEPSPPWLSDALFRNLLVDVAGNTHRAEICIDKLFDWRTPHGRQGVIELRAFEMPPHPRMAVAQVALVRSLAAAFTREPYRAPLVRWGQQLHDRFLLPHWMWEDFEDVLGFLDSRGLGLPEGAYRPFLELRCPVAGRMEVEGLTLEVRNALEPWHVLGEEPTATGTSRYVDSSVERIQVRAEGLVPERHQVLVNGRRLPLRPTGRAGETACGVRFRAWAPPHSLHPHLGIHHPLRLDVLDTWGRRSVGACAYHVWHPEGRAYHTPPLTQFEAAARRAQRFTLEGPMGWPAAPLEGASHPDAPYTLDLRRFHADRPMPGAEGREAAEGAQGAAGAAGEAGRPDPYLAPQPLALMEGGVVRRVGGR